MKNYGTKIALVCLLALTAGCASNPTTGPNAPLYNAATQLVASAAVRETVTRGHASQEVIEARAGRIVTIAQTLKALGSDDLATLPAVTIALNGLLDKAGLDPHERLQADILAKALLAAVGDRVDVADRLASINLVLDAVISSAMLYLPEAAPAPTS